MVRLNATALIVAAAGILIQYLVGVPGYPAVPPGPIILGVAGIAVFAFAARWRWVLILGVVAPLVITVGGLIEGSSWGRLGDPGAFGPFIGTALQWAGMLVALAAGALALGRKAPVNVGARG
jgi:hypothetical protein